MIFLRYISVIFYLCCPRYCFPALKILALIWRTHVQIMKSCKADRVNSWFSFVELPRIVRHQKRGSQFTKKLKTLMIYTIKGLNISIIIFFSCILLKQFSCRVDIVTDAFLKLTEMVWVFSVGLFLFWSYLSVLIWQCVPNEGRLIKLRLLNSLAFSYWFPELFTLVDVINWKPTTSFLISCLISFSLQRLRRMQTKPAINNSETIFAVFHSVSANHITHVS